jgi:molecular chaperone GrpE
MSVISIIPTEIGSPGRRGSRETSMADEHSEPREADAGEAETTEGRDGGAPGAASPDASPPETAPPDASSPEAEGPDASAPEEASQEADGDHGGAEDGDGASEEADGDRPRGPRIEIPSGFDEAPMAGAGEGVVRALAQLREAHDALEKSRSEQKSAEDRLVRLAAEFENYKKRIGREREEDRKFANEKLLKELLPVVDNLERALSHGDATDGDQLLKGVQMVHRQLLDTLKKFGVTQFSAAGEPFNPERHEAMQQMETDEAAPGTVVSEYMKGFELHGRLLRPAMVVVSKAPAEPGNASPPASSGGDSKEGDEG